MALIKWPLFLTLKPAGKEFGKTAEFIFDNTEIANTDPLTAYARFTNPSTGTQWITHFLGHKMQTPQPMTTAGGTMDEYFWFMSIRVRTLEAIPGKRWLMTIDKCSMPLGSQMTEEVEFEPAGEGKTKIRWRVYYNVLPAVRIFHPLVRPFFAHLFRSSLRRFARLF